ncbi:hypothetical protein VPNG_01272 [Cytospora leucostoma]|uniref:BTB domain-containing protein n=1 Tax=Cytospora leucostoma TaxID=1230097 RepID=A0A423XLV8_9PEZI|nr:hypothetical protein VPNG_01272 [Cytospora leucostoma]
MSRPRWKRKRMDSDSSDTSSSSDTDDIVTASSTNPNRLTQVDDVCWGWPVFPIILIAVLSVFIFGPPVVTVAVGPNKIQFPVHRRALQQTQAGQFFNRAFNNGFRESDNGNLELPEDDPDIFNHFLKWLYNSCTGPVVPGELIKACDNPQALRMYIFADKYLIFDFQDFIISELYDRMHVCKWRQAGIGRDTLAQFLASIPDSHMHKLLARWSIDDDFGTEKMSLAQKYQVDNLMDSLPGKFVRLAMREIFNVKFKRPLDFFVTWKKSEYLMRKIDKSK